MRQGPMLKIILGLMFIVPVVVHADGEAQYYKMESKPVLGYLLVETGHFRTDAVLKRAKQNLAELEKEGYFIEDDEDVRTYDRQFTLGRNAISITLTTFPPPGHGVGGVIPTAKVTVTINGHVKLKDVQIGSATDSKLRLRGIVFHEDGVIGFDGDFLGASGQYQALDMELVNYSFFSSEEDFADEKILTGNRLQTIMNKAGSAGN